MSAATVLAKAKGQLGYNGTGPASNPSSKFGAWYGINPGHWCAMFVSWALAAGGHQTAIRTAKGAAYVPDIVAHAKARGQWLGRTVVPRPGDVVVFSFGGVRPDHVGIVESASSAASITSVQGNTTDTAQGRTGNSLRRKVHSNRYVVGYWRPAYPPAPAPRPAAPASSYTVKAGDTLSRIATAHRTSVAALLKLNPAIKDPNRIAVGQRIRVR